eukprot:7702296-Alexandrium_andersonii.AAC.1
MCIRDRLSSAPGAATPSRPRCIAPSINWRGSADPGRRRRPRMRMAIRKPHLPPGPGHRVWVMVTLDRTVGSWDRSLHACS